MEGPLVLRYPFAAIAVVAFIAIAVARPALTTPAKVAEAPTVSPFQMMMDAKNLPVESADAI
jgi:hypothetical protein